MITLKEQKVNDVTMLIIIHHNNCNTNLALKFELV